jgi:hypothetical protein
MFDRVRKGGSGAPASRSETAPARSRWPSPPRLEEMVPRGGQPLSPALRAHFEPRVGVDLGGVRTHSGPEASELAQSVWARAYTVGRDVVFGAGAFQPDTREGRKLLAHELVHVAQQRGSSPANQPLAVSTPGDAGERAADAAAASLDGGDPFRAFRGAYTPPPASSWKAAPPRVAPSLQRTALGSNAFGDWDINQKPHDAPAPGGIYSYRVKITFAPNKATVNASEIDFIQVDRVVDSKGKAIIAAKEDKRMTADLWSVDRVKDRKLGWYGFPNKGGPSKGLFTGDKTPRFLVEPGSSPKPLTPAVLRDEPMDSNTNSTWNFESAAVAKRGPDAGKVYGGVSWGFETDAAGKVNPHPAKLIKDMNRPEFKKSVELWNKQATGPLVDRNDPAQQKIPPLKFP